ncbi:hypothetical protein [Palleronia sp. LCG004]|uniref:hypothetical protein n=1 Tax=Palleronia sp. LCG004 TaxID=3079304 RepID=UPI0029426029|nr:hypothetical protein [Palleronia sp. LCG004]WOI56765.1 hypothetical protein RVY76_02925 [Palleronia sp. LCG004]
MFEGGGIFILNGLERFFSTVFNLFGSDLSFLLEGLLALAIAYFAYQQNKITKENIRQNLYRERMEIYLIMYKVVLLIGKDLTHEDRNFLNESYWKVEYSKFLFSEHLVNALRHLIGQIFNLSELNLELNSVSATSAYDLKTRERHDALKNDLNDAEIRINELFRPYLDFSNY